MALFAFILMFSLCLRAGAETSCPKGYFWDEIDQICLENSWYVELSCNSIQNHSYLDQANFCPKFWTYDVKSHSCFESPFPLHFKIFCGVVVLYIAGYYIFVCMIAPYLN